MSDDPDDPRNKLMAKMELVSSEMDRALTRLEAMHASLDTGALDRLEAEQKSLRADFFAELGQTRAAIVEKMEDILDRLRAVRDDTDNTKAHLLYGLQENLTLSQRLTKLEEEIRRRGGDP